MIFTENTIHAVADVWNIKQLNIPTSDYIWGIFLPPPEEARKEFRLIVTMDVINLSVFILETF